MAIILAMIDTLKTFVIVTALCAFLSCSSTRETQNTSATPTGDLPAAQKPANTGVNAPDPAATPSKEFGPSDIAKLSWLQGTWYGLDGKEPFYERYKFDGTTMIVETLKEDGSLDGEPARFELKDGEFGRTEGDRRSAASEITDTYVQFVPAARGKGHTFRFVKQPHGWDAVLHTRPAPDQPAQEKIYKMQPWQPKK